MLYWDTHAIFWHPCYIETHTCYILTRTCYILTHTCCILTHTYYTSVTYIEHMTYTRPDTIWYVMCPFMCPFTGSAAAAGDHRPAGVQAEGAHGQRGADGHHITTKLWHTNPVSTRLHRSPGCLASSIQLMLYPQCYLSIPVFIMSIICCYL